MIIKKLERKLEEAGVAVPAQPTASEAEDNANNVVANRVAEFVDYHAEELLRLLKVWELKKGLMPYDTACMFERLRGNPRPIVIAPEPEVRLEDLFDDDDLADMAAADAEIEASLEEPEDDDEEGE